MGALLCLLPTQITGHKKRVVTLLFPLLSPSSVLLCPLNNSSHTLFALECKKKVISMDFCWNVSVSGGLPSECPPEKVISPVHEDYSASLDDLFPCHNTEGDVNLEWLSIFVEDCLTSSGNCIPLPQISSEKCKPLPQTHNSQNNNPISQQPGPKDPTPLSMRSHKTPQSLQVFSIPGKARSKRKRGSNNTPSAKTTTPFSPSFHVTHSDPPLLFHQSHWLADSELIVPKRNMEEEEEMEEEKKINAGCKDSLDGGQLSQAQARRCTHCLSQRTPQWRAGPLGPKTLCNACGVRFKSGRLLPEYRPAKSPTFVSFKHSNSHKKVLEMRNSLLSSSSSSSSE